MDVDVATGDTLQHRLEIADERVQVHEHRRAGLLLVAARGQFLHERGGALDVIEQPLPALSGIDVDAGRREPLAAVLMDVAEQRAAGDGNLRGEAADCFHAMGLAQSLLEDAKAREVFDDELDDVGALTAAPTDERTVARRRCGATWPRPFPSLVYSGNAR